MCYRPNLSIQSKHPVKITVFGMDTRSNKMLSLIFQEKLKNPCEIVITSQNQYLR